MAVQLAGRELWRSRWRAILQYGGRTGIYQILSLLIAEKAPKRGHCFVQEGWTLDGVVSVGGDNVNHVIAQHSL